MKCLLFVFLSLPFVLNAQEKGPEGFTISGQLVGLPDSSIVTLTDLNNNSDTLARTIAIKGQFSLHGQVAEPNLHQLNLDGVQKKVILFMGNDQIELKGEVASIATVQVKGSAIHEDFLAFQRRFDPLFKRLGELNQRLRAQPNLQRGDSLVISYESQLKNIGSAIDEFISQKKSSPVAAFLLVVTSQLDEDVTTLENRFRLVDQKWQDGFYGKILKEQLAAVKLNSIGTEALDFTQADTSGKPVSLSSFRGKYVLIDFWASWCKPCRMENPNVVAAYSKFKEKNFTVLGVSLDRSRAPWLQAIKDDHLSWTQVSDLQFWNNEVARMYKIEGIPQNYLVGPDGRVIGRNLRGAQLQEKLCELLGCN